MKRIIFSIIALAIYTITLNAAQIGTWRTYMAYHDITDIQKGDNNIYVLASNNLYYYNTNDNSIHTFDKTNGMNDCNVNYIAWCQAAKKLVIIYSNGNIDLLDKNDYIENISDYKNKIITEDKTIYGIDVYDKYAYISTGFGIVKINIKDNEISDTYNLKHRVDYVKIDDEYIYAATSTNGIGIKKALLTSNLLDPNSWTYHSNYVAKSNNNDPELMEIVKKLYPGGPKYNHFNYMYFLNDRLYTSGGGWKTGSEYFRPGCIQILQNDEWKIYEDDFALPYNKKYQDATSLAVDPKNPEHVFSGNIHSGMIEFLNGNYVTTYNYDNSAILSIFPNNPMYQRIDGLVFDKKGNLFMLNNNTNNSIVEYSKDKEWSVHNHNCLFEKIEGNNLSLGIMRRSILDSKGLIWFVNDHYIHPSLFCYNPEDDTIEDYNNFINQDGTQLHVKNVKYVAEDKNNNIWIGTDIGPFVLNKEQIADKSLGYTQVKVPRNDGTNFADYLLTNLEISCIAIDGGNRKWFGTTNNGVYLISADNNTQLLHFTTENSKLLSNTIEDIAINDKTGEVFFGTTNGLCSYMSDAIQPYEEMTKDNVYAYPNPVTPDYTGLITIVGLTDNANIKITTVNGSLVAEGLSNGGSFIWNGNDLNGNRVASGIYMVQTTTSEGKKGTVCKIAIIN